MGLALRPAAAACAASEGRASLAEAGGTRRPGRNLAFCIGASGGCQRFGRAGWGRRAGRVRLYLESPAVPNCRLRVRVPPGIGRRVL